MKKKDVRVGERYVAKVSNKKVLVRIDETHPYGGWNATNLLTGRSVRIKTAARLAPRVMGVIGTRYRLEVTDE